MQITLEIPDTLGQQWHQFDHSPGFIVKMLSELLTKDPPNRQWQDFLASLEAQATAAGLVDLTPQPHSRVEDVFGLCKPTISVSLAQMEEAIEEAAVRWYSNILL